MPAYFGIFSRDASPIDEGEYLAMRQAMAVVPTEGWSVCGQGRLVLAQAASAEPVVDDRVLSALATDMRLDNRAELAGALGLAPQASLEEFVRAAHVRWGNEFPRHMLGDFTCTLFDGQRLVMARDQLGVKVLFYFRDKKRLVFATDPAGVLGHPAVNSSIDRQSVAHYLQQGELYHPEATFYAQVRKLPAATVLVDDGAQCRHNVYWRPELTPRVKYARTQDYVERLRELVSQAVDARLPCSGPVGAHLSGGLDSSAICALAAQKLEQAGALQAWSWMPPPDPGQELEPEWADALAVAQKCRLPLHFTPFDVAALHCAIEANPLAQGDSTNLFFERRVRAHARKLGVKVILSGWGGDQFASYDGTNRFLDTFFSRRCLATLEEFWRYARRSERPLRRFAGLGLAHVARPLRHSLAISIARNSGLPGLQKFARPEVIASTVHVDAGPPQRGLRIRNRQLDEFRAGHLRNRLEAWAVAGGRQGLEYRYPLLDRRVVEFALGLPPELYRQQAWPRFIFRRAVADLLPEHLITGSIKYEQQRVDNLVGATGDWLATRAEALVPNLSSLINTQALVDWLRTIPTREERELSALGRSGLAALCAMQILQLER